MSLTTDDIQTIKDLLREQSADTERKIDTATTNLEHKLKDTIRFENIKVQAVLERQMRVAEDNLNKKIDQVSHQVNGLAGRMDDISQRMDNITQRVDYIQTSMEEGFDNISQKMVEFIGDMHADHDIRISKLESQINHRNSH